MERLVYSTISPRYIVRTEKKELQKFEQNYSFNSDKMLEFTMMFVICSLGARPSQILLLHL